MTEEEPDYAAIIRSRKPMPTLDLDDLKRRSAQATKATLVLQPAPRRSARPEVSRPTRHRRFNGTRDKEALARTAEVAARETRASRFAFPYRRPCSTNYAFRRLSRTRRFPI